MRSYLAGVAAVTFCFAPLAHSGTLDELTTHGMVASVAGMDIDVIFTPDGRFDMLEGAIVGSWRIDGTRLCLKGDADSVENCTEYPTGKKSGDTFEVQRAEGPMTVRIK